MTRLNALPTDTATGKTKELFNDYVPPFKNLGALFLKAYRKIAYAPVEEQPWFFFLIMISFACM